MNQIHRQPIHLASGKIFQLTPECITSILVPFLDPDKVVVIDIHPEVLTGKIQFNAILLRLHLTYDHPTRAPETLIAKLPTTRNELHDRAMVFQPGSRENWFYRAAAAQSPMRVPFCYLNESARFSGESVLLLEDLAPASPGSWLVGTTLDQAELVLESLARLHAYWWGKDNSKEIQELNQLLSDNSDDEQNLVQELYDSAWPQFVSQMGAALPDDIRQFGKAIVGNMKMVDDLSDLGPPTLVHGDYRLDNILFGEMDGGSICWVVDWEDTFYGSGMIDLTWFLGSCLPLTLSQHENALLQRYHQKLMVEGVKDYSWDEIYLDYRRNMCSSFVQGVLSATLEGGASQYDQLLSSAIAERFIAAVQRLELTALIPPQNDIARKGG